MIFSFWTKIEYLMQELNVASNRNIATFISKYLVYCVKIEDLPHNFNSFTIIVNLEKKGLWILLRYI